MTRRQKLSSFIFLALLGSLLVVSWLVINPRHSARISIIGRWRVISDDPNSVQNHAWEFLPNGICIEKYSSLEAIGPPDYQDVWMDAVIRYKYKPLGNNQYRLWPVRTQIGNQVNFLPMWTILNVTIIEDQAEVFSVSNQLDEMARDMIDDSDKKDSPSEQKTRVNPVDETWVRTS